MADTAQSPLETATGPPDHSEFRSRVRVFLEEHPLAVPRGATVDDDIDEADSVRRAKTFQAALHDAGLAAITYPAEIGGGGLDKSFQEIYHKESAAYRLPVFPLAISHGMCLPVLNDFGTDEQKSEHLEKIIRAEEIWCQMFSEPGAGSDVASLQMRAERDGDQWVLNGQKVWTSGAQYCDYGLVVARTDPEQPKHRGLSMFKVDLSAPGVEIRPLRQITGDAHFNEVFLTDTRIPADWLVGELNMGWSVAIAMLMYERVALGAGGVSGGGGARPGAKRIAELAREHDRGDDPVVRNALADLYIRERLLTFIGMRIRAAADAGRAPGPEGSIAKLATAALAKDTTELILEVIGAGATAWPADDDSAETFVMAFLSAPAMAIAGGTNEVQRNIIGERVLGLPKEPSVDKNVPFKDLLVGTQR
ncbi:MAG: acyl-CoA dehydrogenase family protein [Acidimicrobiia bacterium]|nr:acyl-CoA dehydrogenase family protein [Acidimicrobiia bacterium]